VKEKSPFSSASAGAIAIGALAATISAPAAASLIRVDALNLPVPGGGSLTLDVDSNGTVDIGIGNAYAQSGSDYQGIQYFNRSVSVGNYGSSVGNPVAPGTLIGPGAVPQTSLTLDATSANFSNQIVAYPQIACADPSKGNNCDDTANPIYGIVGNYSVDNPNLGNDIHVPFSFDAGGQTDFGWLNLSISDPGTANPYDVVLTGYAYDSSGNAVTADAGGSVPEPPSLLLLATGMLGLAAYRRRRA
jgi:hypothetical protein